MKLEIDIEPFIKDNAKYDESIVKFLLLNSLNKSKFFINPYTQKLEHDIKRQIISCLTEIIGSNNSEAKEWLDNSTFETIIIENHWLHEDITIIKLIRGTNK